LAIISNMLSDQRRYGYNAIFGARTRQWKRSVFIANSLLSWEQTAEWDIGLDIGLFNNRINAGYDFYTRKTKVCFTI